MLPLPREGDRGTRAGGDDPQQGYREIPGVGFMS